MSYEETGEPENFWIETSDDAIESVRYWLRMDNGACRVPERHSTHALRMAHRMSGIYMALRLAEIDEGRMEVLDDDHP